jgi:hypothetical protein
VAGFPKLDQNQGRNVNRAFSGGGALEDAFGGLPELVESSSCRPNERMSVRHRKRCISGAHRLPTERLELLFPKRILFGTNAGDGIIHTVGDPHTPDQLEVRRRLRLAGFNVPQSLGGSFQLFEI